MKVCVGFFKSSEVEFSSYGKELEEKSDRSMPLSVLTKKSIVDDSSRKDESVLFSTSGWLTIFTL